MDSDYNDDNDDDDVPSSDDSPSDDGLSDDGCSSAEYRSGAGNRKPKETIKQWRRRILNIASARNSRKRRAEELVYLRKALCLLATENRRKTEEHERLVESLQKAHTTIDKLKEEVHRIHSFYFVGDVFQGALFLEGECQTQPHPHSQHSK